MLQKRWHQAKDSCNDDNTLAASFTASISQTVAMHWWLGMHDLCGEIEHSFAFRPYQRHKVNRVLSWSLSTLIRLQGAVDCCTNSAGAQLRQGHGHPPRIEGNLVNFTHWATPFSTAYNKSCKRKVTNSIDEAWQRTVPCLETFHFLVPFVVEFYRVVQVMLENLGDLTLKPPKALPLNY